MRVVQDRTEIISRTIQVHDPPVEGQNSTHFLLDTINTGSLYRRITYITYIKYLRSYWMR
jgi:hypothetical protein